MDGPREVEEQERDEREKECGGDDSDLSQHKFIGFVCFMNIQPSDALSADATDRPRVQK